MTTLHIQLPIIEKTQDKRTITLLASKQITRDDKKIQAESMKLLVPKTQEREYTLTIGKLTLTNLDQECVFDAYADLAFDETTEYEQEDEVSNVNGEINAKLTVSIDLIKDWCTISKRNIELCCEQGIHYSVEKVIDKLPTHIRVQEDSITLVIPQPLHD